MILLQGQTLTPKHKVPLESMSLTIKERDSSCSMVPADIKSGIQVGSWLLDDTEPGKGIVWMVKSIRMDYGTETATVQAEHVIGALRDRVLFGEVTPADITGRKGAATCSAKQAIEYILKGQNLWRLGTFEGDNPQNAYKFDGDDLFSALETVTETLKDVRWDYDLSALPFRLHIRKLEDGDGTEMRPSRNLVTVSRTVDKSGMFTRFYPIGANDKHISGDYKSRNESTWGVIEKIETDGSRETEAELSAWADVELGLHAEPVVTIDVEGVELADATGEPMDKIRLLRMCRVPLEEYDAVIRARIISMAYRDKIAEPTSVRVTMSNSRADVTRIIANMIRRSGKSARTSTKKDKKDMAWMEDTTEHVALCAKGIIGVDEKGNPNWERFSNLLVNGEGITGTVTEIINGQQAHESRFEQNEKKIGMVVGEYDTGGNYVKAGEIVLAINESGESEAHIDANKVYIGNEKSTTVINGKCSLDQVTADYINSKLENIATAYMNDVHVNRLYVDTNIYGPNGLSMYTNGVWQLNLSENNGTYTLTEQKLNGTERTVGTFKRATSLSGAWSSGRVDVTANDPSVPAWWRLLEAGDPEWAADSKSVQIPVWARYGNGQYQRETTGWKAYVNTSPAWQAGWDAHSQQQGDVTVDSVTAPVITGNTVRSEVTITGTASNGTSLPAVFKLAEDTFPRDGSPCINLLDMGRSGNQIVGRIAPLDAIAYGKAQMTGGAITGTPISGSTWSYLNISLTGKINNQTVATGKLSLDRQVAGGEHCVVANVAGDTIARISTESVYNDGRNAVNLANPSWDNGGAPYGSYQGGKIWTPTSRTVSVSTTGRPSAVTKSQWVGIDQDSWANGKKHVYLYKDGWGGTRMAGLEIDIGSWDYGPVGLSDSKFSNIQKEYTINANYKYAVISVTVADMKKRILLKLIR